MRILVVGGGIGGVGAATALAARDHSVDLVEIRPDFTVPGVGINQPANALRALRRIGILDECLAAGYQFDQGALFDVTGMQLTEFTYRFGDPDVPANNAMSRRDLHAILLGSARRTGVDLRLGTTVEWHRDLGTEVKVATTDGRSDTYDLVVAFDGIGSPMRRQMFGPDHEPVHSGFGVLRVTLPRPADLIGMRVYQAWGVKAGFCPLGPDTMYMFVVTPQRPDVVHDPLALDGLLRAQLAPFGGLPGRVRDTLPRPEEIVYSPISDVLLPQPWFRGRIGVLGDAAHACAPHLTQGAAMALEDGVVLAEVLAEADVPLEERLIRFGRRRDPRVRMVQDVSRRILEAEMAITEQDYAESMRARAHDGSGTRAVADFLGRPA